MRPYPAMELVVGLLRRGWIDACRPSGRNAKGSARRGIKPVIHMSRTDRKLL
jgi:hypothetical protein